MGSKANPFVLKFKGNKTFSPFLNISEEENLMRVWKVCTKVSQHLEQGHRLENLSWRLWYLHSLVVDESSSKQRKEFKKVSRVVADGFDRERGISLEDLKMPDYKPRPGSDERLASRVAERSRTRRMSRNSLKMTSMLGNVGLDPSQGISIRQNVGKNARTKVRRESSSSQQSQSQSPYGDVAMTDHSTESSPGSSHVYPSSSQHIPVGSSHLRISSSSSTSNVTNQLLDPTENEPPPYPSNHPFAHSSSQHAISTPIMSRDTSNVPQSSSQPTHLPSHLQQLNLAGPSMAGQAIPISLDDILSFAPSPSVLNGQSYASFDAHPLPPSNTSSFDFSGMSSQHAQKKLQLLQQLQLNQQQQQQSLKPQQQPQQQQQDLLYDQPNQQLSKQTRQPQQITPSQQQFSFSQQPTSALDPSVPLSDVSFENLMREIDGFVASTASNDADSSKLNLTGLNMNDLEGGNNVFPKSNTQANNQPVFPSPSLSTSLGLVSHANTNTNRPIAGLPSGSSNRRPSSHQSLNMMNPNTSTNSVSNSTTNANLATTPSSTSSVSSPDYNPSSSPATSTMSQVNFASRVPGSSRLQETFSAITASRGQVQGIGLNAAEQQQQLHQSLVNQANMAVLGRGAEQKSTKGTGLPKQAVTSPTKLKDSRTNSFESDDGSTKRRRDSITSSATPSSLSHKLSNLNPALTALPKSRAPSPWRSGSGTQSPATDISYGLQNLGGLGAQRSARASSPNGLRPTSGNPHSAFKYRSYSHNHTGPSAINGGVFTQQQLRQQQQALNELVLSTNLYSNATPVNVNLNVTSAAGSPGYSVPQSSVASTTVSSVSSPRQNMVMNESSEVADQPPDKKRRASESHSAVRSSSLKSQLRQMQLQQQLQQQQLQLQQHHPYSAAANRLGQIHQASYASLPSSNGGSSRSSTSVSPLKRSMTLPANMIPSVPTQSVSSGNNPSFTTNSAVFPQFGNNNSSGMAFSPSSMTTDIEGQQLVQSPQSINLASGTTNSFIPLPIQKEFGSGQEPPIDLTELLAAYSDNKNLLGVANGGALTGHRGRSITKRD